MCLVGRLFTSNLVVLVSLRDMRKLLIFHSRRDSLICDYRYTNTILSVKMNRQVGSLLLLPLFFACCCKNKYLFLNAYPEFHAKSIDYEFTGL